MTGINNTSQSTSGSSSIQPINGPLSKAALAKKATDAGNKATEILTALGENAILAMKYTMPGMDPAAAIAKATSGQLRDMADSKAFDSQRQMISGAFAALSPIASKLTDTKNNPMFAKKEADKSAEQAQKSEPPPSPRLTAFADGATGEAAGGSSVA